MRFHLYPRRALLIGLLLATFSEAQSSRKNSVERVALVSSNPLQFQIQTSSPATPQAQIVSSPERLVIDIPNALPGPTLHALKVNRGEVQAVRVGLFSTNPPVTRVVVDLRQPQWYRINPNARGLLVSLGSDSESSADQPATIGWVTSKSAQHVNTQAASFELRKGTPRRVPARQNGASVEFSNGMMKIHSGGATLSEILFQIQKTTGAEIAIPAGMEKERVAADFGPGTPSEVLGELLNGTGLNFVVVGSESDPNQLRSVILSQKQSGIEAPQPFAPAYVPPPTADNVVPDTNDVPAVQAPTDENAPQQLQQPPPPGAGPPPDPPPS